MSDEEKKLDEYNEETVEAETVDEKPKKGKIFGDPIVDVEM